MKRARPKIHYQIVGREPDGSTVTIRFTQVLSEPVKRKSDGGVVRAADVQPLTKRLLAGEDGILKEAQLAGFFAAVNAAFTGRPAGAKQNIDRDAVAVAWGIAEARRTGCYDPYAIARRVPTNVLKQCGTDKKRFETNLQRIGGKLKKAFSKLSVPV